MAYWWQRYENTPDGNKNNPPPDGAPENHFPDQVNNIQRQAMAAVNELGELVLGPGDGSPEPQSVPTGINSDFLKLIYDQLLPLGTIQSWKAPTSNVGATFPIPAGAAFSGVVWVPCDGTGDGVWQSTDYRNKIISGATFTTVLPGTILPATNTGLGGAQSNIALVINNHTLTQAELPSYSLSVSGIDVATSVVPATAGHAFFAGNATINVQAGSQGISLASGAGGLEAAIAVSTVSGSILSGGGGVGHNHAGTVTTADHVHLTGLPPSTTLQMWMRVS